MHKKRFLTVFPDLFPKGLGTALLYKDVGAIPFYMAKARGWNASIVFLATENNSDNDTNYETEVSLIPLKCSTSQVINIFRLALFLCKNARNYDVVNFYHDSPLNTVYALLYKIVNKKGVVYIKLDLSLKGAATIVNNHRHPLRIIKVLLKHIFSIFSVDMYSTECTETFDMLKSLLHFRNRLHLIPNGFTLDIYYSEDELHLKENIIITVGRLGTKQKNTELLIKALVDIDPDVLINWKVYCVGPVYDESFNTYIESMCCKHSILREVLVLTGNICDKNELYELYKRARIFCLTSRWEGFPLVLPEAMYFGCYLISSDLPASRDLTKNATIGALFPSDDVKSLSKTLEDAMSGQIDTLEKGLASHQYIKDEYDWRSIVFKLEKLLVEARECDLNQTANRNDQTESI